MKAQATIKALCYSSLKDDLFGIRFYLPVSSYGHVETVSSPNHTFSLASLTKQYFCTVTSTS